MYTLDFDTLVKAIKDVVFVFLIRMRAGKLNEPIGLLVSSPYDLSVTPCVCANSLFRERHGFGTSAQSKIVEDAS